MPYNCLNSAEGQFFPKIRRPIVRRHVMAMTQPRSLRQYVGFAARVLLALAVMFAGGPIASADTVWVGNSAKALERKNMKIEGLTPEGLVFRSAAADRA